MAARAPGAVAQPLGFPRARRVRKAGEFKRIYAGGRRLANEFFTVNVQPNALGAPRLGLSVAVRTMGNAVERNRVRRLIRESFRLNQTHLPALDIVIGVRPDSRAAAPAQLRASLEGLWQKLSSLQW
ncbi:MAG TPA: ribonuclease P protein component [Steroidobacteraceae bacterium]